MSNTKTGKALDLKLLKRVLHFTRPYRKVLFLSMFFLYYFLFKVLFVRFLSIILVDNYIIIPNPVN